MHRKFPEKFEWLQTQIEKNKNKLFFYFVFLRITPLVPNWFLNISSSLAGVPFHIFFCATMVGIIPYTYMLCQTGAAIDEV